MKRRNAAAFCRDVRTDELLRAQVQRIPEGDDRLERLVELGRRSGYHFTAGELAAAMGQEPVGASTLVAVNASRALCEEQLAAVSGAGFTMDEHWEASLKKPTPILPGGSGLP